MLRIEVIAHEAGERHLEVHLVGVAPAALRVRVVDEVRAAAREHHQDAQEEDPDEELDLDVRVLHGEEDERDERDACDAVGLEAVRGRSDRVTGVVARAVRDHAGVARVVFLDVEDDLHEVGADVGDLREDAARDAEHRSAERLADREADEARAGVVAGHEEEDREHHEELDADEHHADAHAGLQRDVVGREGLAAQAREGRAGVGERVDPDPEPGDARAPGDAEQAEQQDHDDLERLHVPERPEVDRHDAADEQPEERQELGLLEQVGLAGLVDELGDLEHGLVDRKVPDRHVHVEAEHAAEQADDEPEAEEGGAGLPADELDGAEIGDDEVGLGGEGGGRKCHRGQECRDTLGDTSHGFLGWGAGTRGGPGKGGHAYWFRGRMSTGWARPGARYPCTPR